MIRILVVDDHAVVREGLRHVLTAEHGFTVVGEAADGAAGIVQARALTPDVVLLDLTMPGVGGLEAAPELLKAVPGIKVLVLTMHEHGEYVVEAMRAGAHGYVLKDSPPADLRTAIRTVHAGQPYLGPGVSDAMRAGLATQAARVQRQAMIDALTPRERQVMTLVAQGSTNKEAATVMGISPRTVETHRENVMKKLDITSVAELTKLALEYGLTDR
jgi:two-component system response regulator NreC